MKEITRRNDGGPAVIGGGAGGGATGVATTGGATTGVETSGRTTAGGAAVTGGAAGGEAEGMGAAGVGAGGALGGAPAAVGGGGTQPGVGIPAAGARGGVNPSLSIPGIASGRPGGVVSTSSGIPPITVGPVGIGGTLVPHVPGATGGASVNLAFSTPATGPTAVHPPGGRTLIGTKGRPGPYYEDGNYAGSRKTLFGKGSRWRGPRCAVEPPSEECTGGITMWYYDPENKTCAAHEVGNCFRLGFFFCRVCVASCMGIFWRHQEIQDICQLAD
ncbi:hypothetical protein MTO96_015862 [Rhipicephalus appendiculatus]